MTNSKLVCQFNNYVPNFFARMERSANKENFQTPKHFVSRMNKIHMGVQKKPFV